MNRQRPSRAGRGQRRPAATRAAFTIVELLLVMVIAGIVAAMALPMVGDTDTTRLTGAARLLIADLGFAQVESIAHPDDPCVVVFDNGSDSYMVTHSSDTATAITNPADGKAYTTAYGTGRAAELTGVTIQSYSLNGDDELGFGTFGQLDQTTPATVTLAAGGSTITIQLDPTSGEASVSSGP
ncbi:MAG: prepilin-type N-terminal cleavage/methylation domain-containing protein [bacterium]|nr:prepilin-type N-terminal cleavage/methylation domain-containing protein [bacterium]